MTNVERTQGSTNTHEIWHSEEARMKTKTTAAACDCFCLKQQINDLLIFLHKYGGRRSVRTIERDTHALQKNWGSKKKQNTELGPMQYTKIRIDINAGSPLSTATKTAIRKASFILFVGHIVGVWECGCVQKGVFLQNFSDKKTFVVLIDSKEH